MNAAAEFSAPAAKRAVLRSRLRVALLRAAGWLATSPWHSGAGPLARLIRGALAAVRR